MPLHLLLHLEILVGQGLSHVLGFHGEHGLKGLLLRSEDLDLFLVVLEFVSQLQNHLLQSLQFSLQIGCVILGHAGEVSSIQGWIRGVHSGGVGGSLALSAIL